MTFNRRLPVYLLLDCSESMVGEPFDAMTQGVVAMISELRGNPMALETSALSLITFASAATQVVPLCDLIKFQLPPLTMGSGTALGAALTLLEARMAQEVVKTTTSSKGDYKPVIFIMSDGIPTDAWEKPAARIRALSEKKANIIAVGCGPDADTRALRQITETVLVMKDMSAGAFAKFFRWVSASVSVASQRVDTAGDAGVALPNIPQETLEVAPNAGSAQPPDASRHLYLHCRCARSKQFYIMRFSRSGEEGFFRKKSIYTSTGSFKVANFDRGSGGAAPSVPVDQLTGLSPCPYCNGPGAAICQQCSQITCVDGVSTLCGWCGFVGEIGSAAGMSVDRGRG